MAKRAAKPVLRGRAKPRIAPPVPARHDLAAFKADSEAMGITLMEWQEQAVRFLTGIGRDKRHLYREVAIVVARQQGKTTLMKPHIVRELRAGRKIIHIAQNRELPREMFGVIADAIAATDVDLLPKRRGKTIWPRYGSGQEEISLVNGGNYRIAAANRGGARGHPCDTVIIDELREMESFDVIAAAEPTLTMSTDPQMIYLSNAGHDESVVLNAIRARRDDDPDLAYLEWSAEPGRAADDVAGWAEANPALGLFPSVLKTLESAYRKHMLAGTLSIFETEHLCRWVTSMRERLVDEFAWANCAAREPLPSPKRPSMGISVDPNGRRASAAIAWQLPGDDIAYGLRLLYDVPGDPIDIDRLGKDIRDTATRLGVPVVGFDPMADAALAKHFRKTEPVSGGKFAVASSSFVNAVKGGRIAWEDAAAVTEDLLWTTRKPTTEDRRTFEAVRASDDRPITAALAAIRAIGLATGPKPAVPKVL